MSLHDEIMNIPVKFNRGEFKNIHEYKMYREGHCDARHEAAELSAKYENRIEELEAIVLSYRKLALQTMKSV